jgi:hypothetical protein
MDPEDLPKFLLTQQRFDIASEVVNAFDSSGKLKEPNSNGICLSGPHGECLVHVLYKVLLEPRYWQELCQLLHCLYCLGEWLVATVHSACSFKVT